ncbi:MAG: formylglycine-generating enzyme family protein [Phycisphaerae bacterium]|nr:formylglycine-generating enzyme family protein [Phycisphaerae bacterium]
MRLRITTAFFLVAAISITTSVRTSWSRDAGSVRSPRARELSEPLALAAAKPDKPPAAAAKPKADISTWAKISPAQMAAAKKLGVPVAFENSIGMRFVLIPPGTFMMGSKESAAEVARNCAMPNAGSGWFMDEHPHHKVTLTEAFYMSIHEVTQGAYKTLITPKPKKPKRGEKTVPEKEPAEDLAKAKDANDPAVMISSSAAEQFCKKLGSIGKRKYTLPTEAQWEYACRAGTETPFSFGETISTDQANYHGGYIYGKGKKGKYREKPSPVGSFAPNAWGLYDMHGNVSEWCADRYDKYGNEPVSDPKGPAKGDRILRGGSWRSYPGACRSAFRLRGAGTDGVGFRVCCAIPTKSP